MDFDEYINTLIEYGGFINVLSFPFRLRGNRKSVILWHYIDAILIYADSYIWSDQQETVNKAEAYYNLRPKTKNFHSIISSGSFVKYSEIRQDCIWAGYHDARSNILDKLAEIKLHATFVNPWYKSPYMWLINYGEEKLAEQIKYPARHEYYEYFNKNKIALLPENVRDAIRGQT
jgi:hypothetical protein